jgi:tetratricopeptide (TPR) repeat protein
VSIWNSIRTKDEEVLTRLALFYITAGLKDKKPVNECNKVLARMRSSKKVLSAQTVINVIGVYAKAGLIEEGIRLREDVDLKTFSYEESLGKNKTIRFYDITLLDSLAELYGKAGLAHLEKAQTDKKTRDGALYYSAELYELLGYYDRAADLTSSLLSSNKVPKSLRGQLQVKEIFLRNFGSRKKKNGDPFQELLRNRTPKPDMVAEILIACEKLNTECTDAVLQATSMVEKKGGKVVSRVNYALGLYYLNKKNFDRSVLYMEAGRDKSNKNSIVHNEPLMLKHIADANFMAKKYSEALEILFALSEQFPAIRQIQVAMQGIYMREQRSAGDVKIF